MAHLSGDVNGVNVTGVAKVPTSANDAGVTPAAHGSWKRLLVLGSAAAAACAFLPVDIASLLAEAVGIVGMVALSRGAKRLDANRRPFQLIVMGGSAFLVGNVVRSIHGQIVGVSAPFPSPAELFYFVGYGLLIASFALAVARRSADIEGDNVLDAVLFAVCLGVVISAFVVVPYLHRPDVSVIARVATVTYSVGDLLLLSMIVRLAVGSGHRPPAYYLLGGGLLALALADVAMNFADSVTWITALVVPVAVVPYVLAGAAGLHPSLSRIMDRPQARDIQLNPRRLMLLFSAVIGLLGLFVVAVSWLDPARVVITGVGAAASVLIVLGRLALLVQSNQQKAAREAMLRDAAGEFARATGVLTMHEIAVKVLVELLGSGTAISVELGDADPTVVVEAGIPLAPAAATELMTKAIALLEGGKVDEARADFSDSQGQARVVLAVPVSSRRGASGMLVAATRTGVPRHLLHAMYTLGAQLAGAIDGLLLAEEIYRQEQEQRFHALIEHSADLLVVLDNNGLVTFASPASMSLLGIAESQLVGRHPFERVHAEDRFEAAGLLDRSWAVPGVLDPIEVRFRHEEGEWRWFEVLVENLIDQPEVAAVIVHLRDVSDRRRAQERLAASEARFRSLVQHASDLIVIVDDNMCLTYVSPAARRMLGYEPDSLLGRSVMELIPADQLFVEDGKLPAISEAQIRDATGQSRSAELTITDLRGDEAVRGIVINARDVSERKSLEGELRHLAMHDPLTGLANRNLLHERLEVAIRESSRPVAVLFIDIDDFKSLNDTLGHGYGDNALCEVARRLSANLRDGDLAARLGGDEFAVLIEGRGAHAPMEVAERLLAAVRAPIRLGTHRVQLTVSLGAAVRDADSTVATLTRNADIAMYLAKTDGKDRQQLFEPQMLEAFNTRIELKRDLQEVIQRGELRLVYQPVYELDSGRMVSVEALVRWDHPTRGLVPPLQFIPLAEESDIILEIGSWVLDRACAQLAAWRAAGAPPDFKIGVNLSVAQLEHQSLLAEVERTLQRHGLEPSALILEVTESVLAADIDLVQLQLSALSSLGVRLALDDFGTGYSSLGYLQHFELDNLKIDKSFLGDTKDTSQQEGLIRAIVELARGRGMSTTAEGVETEEQLAMLARLGCTNVQGYLFAKPLPPDEVLHAADRAVEAVATVVLPIRTAS
jgi:diguanylate cyclase (GGDEF)-like protein/PAS domain S-box-containing protein